MSEDIAADIVDDWDPDITPRPYSELAEAVAPFARAVSEQHKAYGRDVRMQQVTMQELFHLFGFNWREAVG